MKILNNLLLLFCLSAIIVSCSDAPKDKTTEEKKTTVANPAVEILPAPFHRHEKIEVGPKLIFDVFSWGRGSDSTSSILILRSDSSKNDFSVASSDDLNGRLQEVFNTDMDNDQNPEVLVYYTNNDEYKSAEILCYEFNGKNVKKIRFPDLSAKAKKQYRGKDKFYVKDGKLFREFNLFEDESHKMDNPSGKKVIQYFLRGNSFDLKEVE